MIKPLEKIRKFFVGERNITEVCGQIIKNKKMPKNERLDSILKAYSIYYNSGKFDSEVKFATYEKFYEYFMIEGGKHEFRYEQVRQLVEEDENYFISVVLSKQIATLVNDLGLDKELCTPKQKAIIKSSLDYRKMLCEKDFDFEKFYTDSNVRERVLESNKEMLSQLKNYTKQLQENEEQTL